MDERVVVVNVRSVLPAGVTPVYVGRAMPGRAGSVFGNPLPLVGKTWTPEAERWTRFLMTQAGAEQIAQRALADRGYVQGDAARLYRLVLREQVRRGDVQLAALLELAERVRQGESIALQCWCAPRPCHAVVIRDAVLGYARR